MLYKNKVIILVYYNNNCYCYYSYGNKRKHRFVCMQVPKSHTRSAVLRLYEGD